MLESNVRLSERRGTVLDIDLDFFLSEITSTHSDQVQRRDRRVVPWRERDVCEFLERQCKLSRIAPTPGAIVTTHDEVFPLWKKLIDTKRLASPFNVVHVDAHADLGMGDESWSFICTELLSHPLEHRESIPFRGFNEGSYLAFALACGWISNLCYVHHSMLNRELGDIPPVHLKNFDQDADAIQLKRYREDDLVKNFFRFERTIPVALEPEIPFRRVPKQFFLAESAPDFVFVAQSPLYTPRSADALLEVMSTYIQSVY